MKKSSKIKFGGKMSLGGGLINQAPSWSSPEDAVTLRELGKNYNKFRIWGAQYLNNLNGTSFVPTPIDGKYNEVTEKLKPGSLEWNPLENKDTECSINIDKLLAVQNHEYISGGFGQEDPDYYTGHYNLEYNGHTTRNIKYYLHASDIQIIIDEDIGGNEFKVSTMGFQPTPAYGPYFFQAQESGKRDFLKIINQNDRHKISGFITGYEGDTTTPSCQSLTFEVQPKTVDIDIGFRNLVPENDYIDIPWVYTKFKNKQPSLFWKLWRFHGRSGCPYKNSNPFL